VIAFAGRHHFLACADFLQILLGVRVESPFFALERDASRPADFEIAIAGNNGSSWTCYKVDPEMQIDY
jgi:hypothetical protein